MLLASTGTVHRGRWTWWGVPAVGVVLAAAIAASARWGPDWPAQEFRAWSAHHDGLTAWTNRWYSGQALPGYSVIYPAISAHLGAGLTGLIAVVLATLGAARLAPTGGRTRRVGYQVSVALVLAADLVIGQIPYLVGVAAGVWALWAVRQSRPFTATALAAACSLSSPLAGAFLLLTVPALVYSYGWRRTVPLAAATVGVLVSVLYGGAGGSFPFTGRVFGWTAAFAVLAVVLTRRTDRAIQILGITYGVAALAAFVFPNSIGGNLARFGQLVALPLTWHLLPRMRWHGRAASVSLVVLAAIWPVWPSVTSIRHGAADPSQSRAYYSGLLAFLHTQEPIAGRLEVVFTREHWESMWVARSFPIARGWERQTDIGANPVLYHPLSAAAYRRWLDDNGVSLVALPAVPIDLGGKAEAQLLRRPPSYLVPVWHDANWQVWRVGAPHGLVEGPATMRTLGAASFVLDFRESGTAVVRIRGDGMWSATDGEACISRDRHGWLTVQAPRAGRVTVRARASLEGLGAGPRCS